MGFSSKKSFTIIEILIIMGVLSVGLLSIITVMTRWFTYVQQSRQRVLALNLAREGIEAVYQIRNTNRQRRSSEKDQCWLKTNPLVDENSNDCKDDAWMLSGSYILDTALLSWQRYFLLTGYSAQRLSLANGVDTNDLSFRLCLLSGTWYACPGTTTPTSEWTFFREIYGYWLFLKDQNVQGWQYVFCGSGGTIRPDTSTCWSSQAKEFEFCSRVVYGGLAGQEVSLCGSITNFAANS